MTSSPFTLRSDDDLLATFRDQDQRSVVLPRELSYPQPVQHYFAWTEPSGSHVYLVFKRQDWERPLGLVFQRNGAGSHLSPAGMCEWCHSMGPSDEIGLLTTAVTNRMTGGTWLCLDLSCLSKIEEKSRIGRRSFDKLSQKLFARIGEFYGRTILDEVPAASSSPRARHP